MHGLNNNRVILREYHSRHATISSKNCTTSERESFLEAFLKKIQRERMKGRTMNSIISVLLISYSSAVFDIKMLQPILRGMFELWIYFLC